MVSALSCTLMDLNHRINAILSAKGKNCRQLGTVVNLYVWAVDASVYLALKAKTCPKLTSVDLTTMQ